MGLEEIKALDEFRTWLPVLNIDKLIIDMNHNVWQAYQPFVSPDPTICRCIEGEGMGAIWQIEDCRLSAAGSTVHPRSIRWESVLYSKSIQWTRHLIESTNHIHCTVCCLSSRNSSGSLAPGDILKNPQKYVGKRHFFSKLTTRRKIEKNQFSWVSNSNLAEIS